MKNTWSYRANPDNVYHIVYQQEINMWGWWAVCQLMVLSLITLQAIHSPLAFVLSLVVFNILGGLVFLIWLFRLSL